MKLRLFGTLAVAVLVGCGGSGSTPPVAEGQGSSASTAEVGENVDGIGAGNTGTATFESLVTSIEQSVQNGKFAEAYNFAVQALELQPDDRDALFMATQLAQRRGMELEEASDDHQASDDLYLKSAEYLRRAGASVETFTATQRQYAAQVFYNESRVHARRGEHTSAIAALEEASEAGFNNYRLIDADEAFATLRETPEFEQAFQARREELARLRAEAIKAEFDNHEPFAFDFDLVSTTGNSVKMADYKGKVLIVDFWGTWCPPCRDEIPHFLTLLEKYQDDGLEVVGINYERGDADTFKSNINKFAKDFGITYPCLIGDDATQARVPVFQGYPTTLFIDRSGTVRLQLVGYHPYDHLEGVVESLLADASEDAPPGDAGGTEESSTPAETGGG